MQQSFDVIVIGAGPGGYVCAIRAAQLGLSVACVESWTDDKGAAVLGGTCLNVGCIPSKALLQITEKYHETKHHLVEVGINAKEVSFDLSKIMAHKNTTVNKLSSGVKGLFRKNKVTLLHGRAEIVGKKEEFSVKVGEKIYPARHIVIATGSSAKSLPGTTTDNELINDNVGALAFDSVPKRLGIIGAGVIGLEMGSVWARLGAEVTLLEGMPTFLSAADEDVAKEAHKIFTQKLGLSINLGVKVQKIEKGKKDVTVAWLDANGQAQKNVFDRLIVSVGRTPNTQGLGLEKIGIHCDDRGAVIVDDQCQTQVNNIFAIGDVVRGPMLAHKASEEGIMVAEVIAGGKPHINFDTIPWVMYTEPEIAWVGPTEQYLRERGVSYKVGLFPFSANGRALASTDSSGFAKMIACAKTDKILAVHIIGREASEMIGEAVVAMEFSASSEDIARIVHAHPTRSEAIHEAALGVDKRMIHL